MLSISIQLPHSLEHELQAGYHDLVSDVVLLSREWQLASKREEYFQAKMKAAEEEAAAQAAAAASRSPEAGEDAPGPKGRVADGSGSQHGDQEDTPRSTSKLQ